jgi:hypothetical protein
LSEIVTTAPPAGAAPVSVTVQFDVPEPVIDAGVQLTDVKEPEAGVMEMDEPVAVSVVAVPVAPTAYGFVIWIEEEVAVTVGESVIAMVARTPVPIGFAFSPDAIHV